MGQNQRLSLGEFLSDIHLIVTSPSQRFAVICERGAKLGSLALLVIPTYLGLGYVGGLYFERDPFPGYSFIPPLIAALALVYLKLYLIHVIVRAFQRRKRMVSIPGSFSDLVAVFGYTGVPVLLVMMLVISLFMLLPREMGYFTREYGAISVSIMVGLSIGLFIWNLVLIVLALRTVYRIRDLQIVVSYILGSALLGLPALGTLWIIAPTKINLEYVQPILADRILRYMASDPTSSLSPGAKMTVHIDRLAFRLRDPKRFEIIAFRRKHPDPENKERKGGLIYGPQWFIRWEGEDNILGRIVGLPGDAVELVKGKLSINGQPFDESYLTPSHQADASLPLRTVAPFEYLVLPENRQLIDKLKDELVVSRDRIRGRELIARWPLGWWIFNPTVFLQGGPAATTK